MSFNSVPCNEAHAAALISKSPMPGTAATPCARSGFNRATPHTSYEKVKAMQMMTKEQLIEDAFQLTDGKLDSIASMPLDDIYRLMTITQYVTDVCLNEIENRDELRVNPEDGVLIIPYMAEHYEETCLTRDMLN